MTRSFARLGALAAMAGGLLRAAASFAPTVIRSDVERKSLYVVVDVCLSVGLLGFWRSRTEALGRRGAIGLALALAGIATVRANPFVSAVDLYPAGALITACGVVVLSARAWTVKKMSGWIPLAFVLSTLVGVIGSVVKDASILSVWSGVTFGAAFAGLGLQTWIASNA